MFRTPLCYFLICEDHELFYEHMSIVSFSFFDLGDVPLLVECEVALSDLKEDFPFFFSTRFEDMVER